MLTFHFTRWKGENVATTEITDVLVVLDFIEEANVYGVKVPGNSWQIQCLIDQDVQSLIDLIALKFTC